MSNEIQKVEVDANTVVQFGTAGGFQLMLRQAKMLSQSQMVPKAFQNNPADCCIALEMATRMNASPFMVMQNIDIIHGKPSFSAKFMVAAINACGRFSPINYRMIGTKGKDTWGCVAYAKTLETGDVLESPEVTIGMAKKEGWYDKNGSKWQTIPELMLRYRSATFFARTFAPDVTMGMLTKEEILDIPEADDIAVGLSPIEQADEPEQPVDEEVEAPVEEEVEQETVEEKSKVDPMTLPEPALVPAIYTHKDRPYFAETLEAFGAEAPHHLNVDEQRELLSVLLIKEDSGEPVAG